MRSSSIRRMSACARQGRSRDSGRRSAPSAQRARPRRGRGQSRTAVSRTSPARRRASSLIASNGRHHRQLGHLGQPVLLRADSPGSRTGSTSGAAHTAVAVAVQGGGVAAAHAVTLAHDQVFVGFSGSRKRVTGGRWAAVLKGSGTGVLGAAVSCFNDSLHGTCRARGPHRAARRCSDHPTGPSSEGNPARRSRHTAVCAICPHNPGRQSAYDASSLGSAAGPVGSVRQAGRTSLPRPPSVRGRTTPRGSACTSCLIRTSTGRCAGSSGRLRRGRAVAIAATAVAVAAPAAESSHRPPPPGPR